MNDPGMAAVSPVESLRDRFRWKIWHWLCKRPNVCPANAHSRLIWRQREVGPRIDWVCREDLARNGACWCGKLKNEVAG